MSVTVKCTSWLGHKFEARYTLTPPEPQRLNGTNGGVARYIASMTKRTYERDICVRCGMVVPK